MRDPSVRMPARPTDRPSDREAHRMSTTTVLTPTSRVRLGHARVDITPPVGIYHRMWGAARHDQSTGVHRPLLADAIVIGPFGSSGTHDLMIRIHFDSVGLARTYYDALVAAIHRATGVPEGRIHLCPSHTHSAGLLTPDRIPLPGGHLIPGYHAAARDAIVRACTDAIASLAPATLTYAEGTSAMGANRDYPDDANGIFTCGYNPDAPADQTVTVMRATEIGSEWHTHQAERGSGMPIRLTAVTYAAHPTSLAWENTLLSPDYPGALRETVEAATEAPCIFMLAPCGDQGPRDNYTGGPAVADANGRQVGYAALGILSGMAPPGTDRIYAGPVVSGATLGTWSQAPVDASRASRFAGGRGSVPLQRRDVPSTEAWAAELARHEAERDAADARGDTIAARNATALAERARRWRGRLSELPDDATPTTYPMPVSVYRIGDAIWATCAGEPYAELLTDLRRRFPGTPILLSPLDGPMSAGYLLKAECYGTGLYQEEPSLLGAGCLEALTGAIAARIAALKS